MFPFMVKLFSPRLWCTMPPIHCLLLSHLSSSSTYLVIHLYPSNKTIWFHLNLWFWSVQGILNTHPLNLSSFTPPTHLYTIHIHKSDFYLTSNNGRRSSRHMGISHMDGQILIQFQGFSRGTVVHCLKGTEWMQCSTRHLLIIIVTWAEDIRKIVPL